MKARITKICGWVGAAGFMLCGVPQAFQAIEQGHANGLSHAFLGLWLMGEIGMLGYVLLKYGLKDKPMLLNYGFSLTCLLIILWVKYY